LALSASHWQSILAKGDRDARSGLDTEDDGLRARTSISPRPPNREIFWAMWMAAGGLLDEAQT